MPGRLLLVDDNRDVLDLIAAYLGRREFEVVVRTSAEECLQKDLGADFDVALVDLRLPGMGGAELCARLCAASPTLPVIVITAHGSMDAVVEVLRAGAHDFLVKPFDLDQLRLRIESATSGKRLREEVQRLRQLVFDQQRTQEIIGDSACMQDLKRQVQRIGELDATVLITGESGTGKELLAAALHRLSPRRDGPFVAVNCAAISEQLFESELFGHTKGAFTDAHVARKGFFVEANGGTLFLDEIGELPLSQQVKLLRALQERKIRPVGSAAEVPVNVRFIAATNRDLEAAADAGQFRKDLFYRLNVLRLEVPPLRARGNDVLLLAQHFIRRSAQQMGRDVRGMLGSAAEVLLAYGWPGNVRELENCITRAVAFAAHDQLTSSDLPEHLRSESKRTFAFAANDAGGQPTLREVEERYIDHVLRQVGGNKSMAARILGVSRRTLHRKLAGEGDELESAEG